MSTIYAFHAECAALGAVPASDDLLLLYDTSTGITKSVTAALMAGLGGSVTAGTTSAAVAASGVTVMSTLASAATLTDPVQAGQEATIVFPSSTAVQTVAPVAATILGSTVTATGATKITHSGTSDALAGSITLVATSTSKWCIKSLVTGYTTLGAPATITTT
jgi:hypothetical protein